MQTAWLQKQDEQVFYNTATFRHLVDSAARPGKLNQLEYPAFLGEPPLYSLPATQGNAPVNLYALGVLLTLLDSEVSFLLASDGQPLESFAPAVRWITLRSGAAPVEPSKADFALFCDGTSGTLLGELNTGTLLEPETSATAIYCVKQLSAEAVAGGNWLGLELAGPGIMDSRLVYVTGLNPAEIERIKATRRDYPLGLDVFLVDEAGLCLGLPRSTRLGLS